MNGSIFASILYTIAFVAFYVTMLLLKKSERKLNGVSWLVFTLLIELCWSGLIVAIINIVHIPINIWSVGIIYLLSAILVGIKIYREKEIQKYEWNLYDILVSVGVFVTVALMLYRRVGVGLQLNMINSDAAVHLKNAVSVVLEQKLPTMYFAPFQTAMVLEVTMPWVAIYNFYKVFMIVDAILFAVEIVFFFAFCREYLEKVWMKILGVIICVFYAAGYPLMSYQFTFYYWAMGVMMMGFVALLLRMYRKEEIRRDYIILFLSMACNAVTMCYMLIGPMTFIAAFICLMLIVKKDGKLVTKSNIALALKVFLIPTILAVYYCYFEFLRKEQMSAVDVIAFDGGIYRELYINFLLLIPIVVYMIVRAIRKKKIDENMIFFLVTCLFVFVLFVLAIKLRVSGYYYYKFYYPLWFFAFVLTLQGVKELLENQWEAVIAYGALFVFLFVMHYGGVEEKVVAHSARFQEEIRSSEFFHIYDYNLAYMQVNNTNFKEDYMEMCKYIVDELETSKDVPLIATMENYATCYWYEAITGEDSSDYYGWWYSFDDVSKKLEKQKVEYFAMCKDSPVWENYEHYFKEYPVVFENENSVVYSTKR